VDGDELAQRMTRLVDPWCDRRCLRALREILAGWPITSGLTDDWAHLGDALRGVRAFASDELTPQEAQNVEESIAAVDTAVSG
jgi:hypothetical protein